MSPRFASAAAECSQDRDPPSKPDLELADMPYESGAFASQTRALRRSRARGDHPYKRCGCGVEYTEAAWKQLVHIGFSLGLDHRICARCLSTLAIAE